MLLITNISDKGIAHAKSAPSVLEQVLARNELRCGYFLWPATVERDPNTGKLSGAFYDYMEALGKQLEIKITWAEEVNFADIPIVLQSGRVDAICSGAWTNPMRGKFVDFTVPIAYASIRPYVRSDDRRFDDNSNAINQPNVGIATVDGESAETIAAEDFPRAQRLSAPKGTEGTQMLLNVLTKKSGCRLS